MTETKKKAPATTKAATAKPKTTPVKKAAVRKPAAKKASSTSTNNEANYNAIQQAAYLIAERNNFSGDPLSYWLEAEARISGK